MGTINRDIRAGVVGVGRLGREHTRIYASTPGIGSLAVYDQVASRAAEVAGTYEAAVCTTVEELCGRCDVISICTPATHHHAAAAVAFGCGVHVLVEKPIASNCSDGAAMVRLARERGCILQIGHVERFNGAFEAARAILSSPRFIESHRLSTFSPRGTDVSVVVDLMIHDIDLILTVVGNDEVVDLRASGTEVLTDSPDIVNARLEFGGGCVANITASRISREPLRKVRFFQENLYVSVDLREKSVEAFRRNERAGFETAVFDPTAFIRRIDVDVDRSEPLRKEISSFIEAVRTGREPAVTGEQALAALVVAERIQAEMEPDRGRG